MTKSQRIPKSQAPMASDKTNKPTEAFWSLELGASWDLGIWSLGFLEQIHHRQAHARHAVADARLVCGIVQIRMHRRQRRASFLLRLQEPSVIDGPQEPEEDRNARFSVSGEILTSHDGRRHFH